MRSLPFPLLIVPVTMASAHDSASTARGGALGGSHSASHNASHSAGLAGKRASRVLHATSANISEVVMKDYKRMLRRRKLGLGQRRQTAQRRRAPPGSMYTTNMLSGGADSILVRTLREMRVYGKQLSLALPVAPMVRACKEIAHKNHPGFRFDRRAILTIIELAEGFGVDLFSSM